MRIFLFFVRTLQIQSWSLGNTNRKLLFWIKNEKLVFLLYELAICIVLRLCFLYFTGKKTSGLWVGRQTTPGRQESVVTRSMVKYTLVNVQMGPS